jgi:hypothetical protein
MRAEARNPLILNARFMRAKCALYARKMRGALPYPYGSARLSASPSIGSGKGQKSHQQPS